MSAASCGCEVCFDLWVLCRSPPLFVAGSSYSPFERKERVAIRD